MTDPTARPDAPDALDAPRKPDTEGELAALLKKAAFHKAWAFPSVAGGKGVQGDRDAVFATAEKYLSIDPATGAVVVVDDNGAVLPKVTVYELVEAMRAKMTDATRRYFDPFAPGAPASTAGASGSSGGSASAAPPSLNASQSATH